MSAIETAVEDVMREIENASRKWPGWPLDPVHAAAIVAEEAGELVRAALKATYEGGSVADMHLEAVQTAATAIRFLVGWYSNRPSDGVQDGPKRIDVV